MNTSHTRMDVGRAYGAARKLLADPDDLPQVFTLIESLSGGTLVRILERMSKSESGRKLLAEKPDIVPMLVDREALRRLPEGTLGRAYLAFVERENISAEGIRAAADKGMKEWGHLPSELGWTHARMRDTHDLFHAAVGYQGDVLGELALLAFMLGQAFNPAVAVIVVIGLAKTLDKPDAKTVIYDGFRRGKKAKFLTEQAWESMLELPLEEVRRRLSLEGTPQYTRLNSSEIKMRAAAATA
jgi:ubiquinone biosynthesis protein COQ4